MTSTTSKPTKSMPVRPRRIASRSRADGPPASGVPVPGRVGRIDDVDVEADERRPVADPLADRCGDRRPGRARKTSSVVRYSSPSSVRRPVQSPRVVERAAQPDLDRVADVDEALLDRPPHPRPVVVLLAEVAVPGVGVRVEVDDGDRAARSRRPEVGQRAGVVAADQERDDAGLDDRRDGRLDRRVAPLGVAGHDRDVAVVDARQDVERLDVEVRVVRPEHHARGADGVRAEPAADPVRDAGVERDADDRDVDVLERPDVAAGGRTSTAR